MFGSAMHIWSDLFFALLVPLLPAIKDDLDLSFAQIGLLRSVFSGASAVLQIPVGFLAESMGEFWLLVLGNVWVSIGLVAMAFSPLFILLLVVSFLGGLGGGAQHPLASSMVSRAYDDKGRSTAVGTVNFAGDIGKMIAPAVAGLIAIQFSWRTTL
jgi:MFS family permease